MALGLVTDLKPQGRWDTNEVCRIIRHNLKLRSGRTWSVTHGRGTAYCWLTITAAPEDRDGGDKYGGLTGDDAVTLAGLLGLSRPVHFQGQSVPAGDDYYREYVQRSAGRTPTVRGQQYWD